MPFCSNCGEEINEGTKFCPKCGVSQTYETETTNNQQNNNLTIACSKCGTLVPVGNMVCTNCGSPLNPEKHTTAIVIGYIGAIFAPIIGIIFGIYLLTRNNKDVHKHGIIMIILAIVMIIIYILFFSYLAYASRPRYYRYYYY